jgi:hypothetical protein
MSKPSLPTLAAAINELSAEIESLKHRPEQTLLAPQAIEEIKHTQVTIRTDLTETRQWLADLGRAWQAHREETTRRVSEIAGIIDAIPEPVPVEIDERPDQDIVDLQGAVSDLRASLAAATEAVPDIVPITRRMDELDSAIVAVGERIPDIAPIAQRIDDMAVVMDKIVDMIPDKKAIADIAGTRLCTISEQVQRLWDALAARTCPDPVDLRPVVQAIEEIKHTQVTIRTDLTETRQWLADLGRVVQRGGKS